MKYSELTISYLLDDLQSKAFNKKTPKKYSVPMFEAWEVIQLLQKKIAALKGESSQQEESSSCAHAETCTTVQLTAEEAAWLERMKPLAPIRDSLADRGCPNCNAYISWDALNDPITEAPSHCKCCGQTFDWNNEPTYDSQFV